VDPVFGGEVVEREQHLEVVGDLRDGVITGPDSPAVEPRNWPSAGTKSPLDSPCRYSGGG
jgi:hypothetical protein